MPSPNQNDERTLLASTAIVSDATTAAILNEYGRGVTIYIDVTAVTGTTPTLDISVEEYGSAADVWRTIPGASFAQMTTTTSVAMTIYPGLPAVANTTINHVLSRQWRLNFDVGGTTPSFTTVVSAVMHI